MSRLRRFPALPSSAAPRWQTVAGLAGFAVLLGACASDAPQDSLDPESGSIAEQIMNLATPVFLIAAIVFVIVEGGVLFLLWKFRNRDDHSDEELPEQVHGHMALEVGWTILPALLLTGVAVFTVATILDIDSTRADANQPETRIDRIEVVGHQWWWEYKYYLQDDDGPDESTPDFVTANDLVIPAGETIEIEVTSADVIHSFWIPRLNGKMDAVPGRFHPLVLESDAPGTFIGQCTEYCGLSHGYMHQRVLALDSGAYNEWLDHMMTPAEVPADPGEDADPNSPEAAAARGAETFTTVCSSCHLVEGVNDEEFADLGYGRGANGIDVDEIAADLGIDDLDSLSDEEREELDEALAEERDRVAEEGLVAGPAPNLTHLMSRGVFAGGVFDLWVPGADSATPTPDWSDIGFDNGGTVNEADLKAWIRDAPSRKPMDPDGRRGMPAFDLPEDQVDDLYEFLTTLD